MHKLILRDVYLRGIRLLHPHPALLLSNKGRRYLVIGDLHIGFEERYAEAGVDIKGSVEDMAKILFELLREHKPDQLIILGDVKESVNRISNLEWHELPQLFEQISEKVKTTIIPGNHDGSLKHLLPKDVTLLDKTGLLIGQYALLHGHTRLLAELSSAKRIIMGHIHPRYSRRGSPLSGQPIWLFLKVEKKMLFNEAKDEDLEIYVVPAFNKELAWAGYIRRGKIISYILRKVREDIKDAVIMSLNGDILGGRESLEYVL